MNLRGKRRQWHGVVGGLGVVAALGGIVGGWYSIPTGIVLALAVWIIGATVVNLVCE